MLAVVKNKPRAPPVQGFGFTAGSRHAQSVRLHCWHWITTQWIERSGRSSTIAAQALLTNGTAGGAATRARMRWQPACKRLDSLPAQTGPMSCGRLSSPSRSLCGRADCPLTCCLSAIRCLGRQAVRAAPPVQCRHAFGCRCPLPVTLAASCCWRRLRCCRR
jgi:hypothetical protein